MVQETAIAAWKAERRATRRGQSAALLGVGDHHSADAAGGSGWRSARPEGLVASILRLLYLDLAAPDHSTISRRGGETLSLLTLYPAFLVSLQGSKSLRL